MITKIIKQSDFDKRSAESKKSREATLLWIIKFDEEYYAPLKEDNADAHIMQAYVEAAACNGMSSHTFRYYHGLVKRYPKEKIIAWFRAGIGFDHLRKAQSLSDALKCSPSKLLDEAVNIGNDEGETMTVDQMESFVMGETGDNAAKSVATARAVELGIGRLLYYIKPLKWDADKQARLVAGIKRLIEEIGT